MKRMQGSKCSSEIIKEKEYLDYIYFHDFYFIYIYIKFIFIFSIYKISKV